MFERGSINRKVLMNTHHLTQRKEVTALDADVPLSRSSLIRFHLSNLRLQQARVDYPYARHVFTLHAA
jgi:hypothetical protein